MHVFISVYTKARRNAWVEAASFIHDDNWCVSWLSLSAAGYIFFFLWVAVVVSTPLPLRSEPRLLLYVSISTYPSISMDNRGIYTSVDVLSVLQGCTDSPRDYIFFWYCLRWSLSHRFCVMPPFFSFLRIGERVNGKSMAAWSHAIYFPASLAQREE